MSPLINTFTVASLVVLVGGCSTSLSVKELKEFPEDSPVNGIIYYLPQSSFQTSVKRVLKECPYSLNNKVFINVENKVEVIYSTINDYDSAYVIDYDSLSAASKEYSLEVFLYPNGTLKSINSTSSDKTGEVISSLAKTASMLALLNTTGMAGVAVAPTDDTVGLAKSNMELNLLPTKLPLCSTEVEKALAGRSIAEAKMKIVEEKLEGKLKELQELEKHIADSTQLQRPDQAYDTLLKELGGLHTDATNKKKILFGIMEKLTLTSLYQINGIKMGGQSLHISPDEIVRKGWVTAEKYTDAPKISAEYLKLYFSVNAAYAKATKTEEELKTKSLGQMKDNNSELPKTPESSSSDCNSNDEDDCYGDDMSMAEFSSSNDEDSGIVYQHGQNVSIKICADKECSSKKPYLNEIVYASDAGRKGRLPFKSGVFQDNGFEAKFSDKGMLEYVKFSSTSATEKASGSLSNAVNAYADYKKQRADYTKAELEAEEAKITASEARSIVDLEHQILILTKTKELADLGKESDSEIDALKRELELKILLRSIEDLKPDKAADELARLKIEIEIQELLKDQ